jgi:hypothetical protein
MITPVPPPALRHALVTAIDRRRRRRARYVRVGTGTVCAGLAVLALTGPFGGGPQRALAVETDGAWIELRIADAAASAGKMTRELHAAGIDAEVYSIAVGPELVGRWVAVFEVPDNPARQSPVRLRELRITRELVRIHRDFAVSPHPGYFVFYAGRAPRPGEAIMLRKHGKLPPTVDLPGLPPRPKRGDRPGNRSKPKDRARSGDAVQRSDRSP